ncbi:unnamed protein product [Blepharisma stoltei]|uniref:LisH domain-containing protein ARMC9 n=1 Tax=Blepharisma stoltei TaxID=1481888 RepID=A0AAU9I8D5_9CILI|nr:unnamed protein product [Blepharisma stoltei]
MENDDRAVTAHFYLVLNNLVRTIDTLQSEFSSRTPTTHEQWHSSLLRAMEEGNRQRFFDQWERYIPDVCKTGEYEKLEFFSHIYFTVLPLIHGKRDIFTNEMRIFKDFLNTKGADFCKTTEFLPFYALPHIPNPLNHPTFKKYFNQAWCNQLLGKVQGYLKELATRFSLPKEQSSEASKQEMAKARHREEYLRSALIESNTKWTNFAFTLLGISKQLLAHIGGLGEANLPLVRKKVSEYEKFLMSSEDSVSNASSFLPVSQKEHLANLNYQIVKRDLFNLQDEIKACALFQALRWRLTRTPASVRRAVLDEYVREDILKMADSGLSILLQRGNPRVIDYACKLANVMASEIQGRSYLLADSQLIPTLVSILRKETQDTVLRQNTIGILQKLSLRRRPQSVMIEYKVIEWLISILESPQNLSEYTLEYSSALLMNLSLRTAGKNVCEKLDVLPLLGTLMEHENPNVRTYINGTLYSIFTRQTLKRKAREMGFEQHLEKLYNSSEEAFKKQIYFVLEQLRCEYEDSCYSDEEQDEEEPSLNPDEESEQISDDEDMDDLLDASGLLGEELLRQYQTNPTEESISRTSFYQRAQQNSNSTSVRASFMDIDPNKSSPQDFNEIVHAFKPRSKIPRTPVHQN